MTFTEYAIPDGEGFNALPIVFIYVITRSGVAATKQSLVVWEIASLIAKRVARNDIDKR